LPGLTRQSIHLRKKLRAKWMDRPNLGLPEFGPL
jgi:hypothetical protein